MNAPAPLPDGYVLHLPTAKHPRPQHQFGVHVRMAPNKLLGRSAQTERICQVCGLIKITVHPAEGGGWREWRFPDGDRQYVDTGTPECVAVVVGK